MPLAQSPILPPPLSSLPPSLPPPLCLLVTMVIFPAPDSAPSLVGSVPSSPPASHPQLQALQSQVEFLEQSMVDKSLVSRQEAKIRELETRLEFERTQVKRLEVGAHSSRPTVAGRRCPGGWSHTCWAGPGRPGMLLRGRCQAARPADRGGACSPARPACSPGTVQPACFTFCFRAYFLPRDRSSLAFRLHIFLHHELPPQVRRARSLSGRVINMQRAVPLL